MGKTITTAYRIVMTDRTGTVSMCWSGKASQARLEEAVFSYANSLEANGANAHISKQLGYVPYPTAAKLVRQSDGQLAAEWRAGAFQVYTAIKPEPVRTVQIRQSPLKETLAAMVKQVKALRAVVYPGGIAPECGALQNVTEELCRIARQAEHFLERPAKVRRSPRGQDATRSLSGALRD